MYSINKEEGISFAGYTLSEILVDKVLSIWIISNDLLDGFGEFYLIN